MRLTKGAGSVRRTWPRPASPFLLLPLVTIVFGLPLLFGRVLAGQDIVTYLINAQQTAANLSEGVVFPAWGGGFNSGFGSPALLFYPPLTSYLNAIPVLAGVPLAVGVWLLVLALHLASGLALYGWLSDRGERAAALPAAVVYLAAPYRFVDVYLRSALSEHVAFLWPPLILWAAAARGVHPAARVALVAVTTAGLVLTNLPMAVLFGIALAVWFVVSDRVRGLRPSVLTGVALGFVAAAFALVPQAMSSVVLDTERYYGAGADNFRPSANTLFVDGFGVWNLNTVFSLAVVVTAALGLVAYVVLPVTLRRRRSERLMVVAVVAGVVATTGIAGPVWDLLPVVSKLQFPWRITALLTFVCAVLVGRADARRAWIMVLVVAAAAVPFSSWDRTAPVEAFVAPRPAPSAPGTVFPDPTAAWQAGSGGWYWRHEKLVEPWLVPKTQHPLLLEELSGQPVAQFDSIRGRPAAVSGGSESSIRVVRWGQTERELEVDLDAGGSLVWRVIPFPDMQLRLDGSPVPGFVDSETGLLAQNVPAGRHRVTWNWSPPPAFRAARIVSMLAVLVVACLAVVGWRLGSLQRRVDRV